MRGAHLYMVFAAPAPMTACTQVSCVGPINEPSTLVLIRRVDKSGIVPHDNVLTIAVGSTRGRLSPNFRLRPAVRSQSRHVVLDDRVTGPFPATR